MRSATILCLLASAPWAAACESKCAPGDHAPTLAIGWGEDAFEPLDADEPRMAILRGPQGGWHVPVALEATGLDGTDLLASHLRATVGAVVRGETQPWVRARCDPGTKTLQSWNNLLVLDVPPEELHGHTAAIEAELTDLEDRTATSSVDVVLYDPSIE